MVDAHAADGVVSVLGLLQGVQLSMDVDVELRAAG